MPDDRYDWRADIHSRIAAARLHPQDEADVVEEVAQHLEAQFADLAARIGAGPARARLLAQLQGPELDDALARRRRRTRPTRARTWSVTSLARDVRYGVRSLRRSPGTVIAGTAALALGIGLTAVMYSIIYGMEIRRLAARGHLITVIGEKQFWKLVEPASRSKASSRRGKTKQVARRAGAGGRGRATSRR